MPNNNDNYEYMKFLDLSGAQQIWNTAKQTFVQTVNGVGIDANGNVQLNAGIDVEANVSLSGSEADLTSLLVDTTRYKVSKVVSNPTLAGNESDLTSIEINGTKYHVGSKPTLLWSNATPNAVFDNGYVSLSQNTSNFDMIMIAYKRLAPSGDVSYFLAKATQTDQFEIITSWNYNGTLIVCSRGFFPSGNSCYIYNCVSQHNNSSYDGNKAFVIPTAIYGIKY